MATITEVPLRTIAPESRQGSSDTAWNPANRQDDEDPLDPQQWDPDDNGGGDPDPGNHGGGGNPDDGYPSDNPDQGPHAGNLTFP